MTTTNISLIHILADFQAERQEPTLDDHTPIIFSRRCFKCGRRHAPPRNAQCLQPSPIPGIDLAELGTALPFDPRRTVSIMDSVTRSVYILPSPAAEETRVWTQGFTDRMRTALIPLLPPEVLGNWCFLVRVNAHPVRLGPTLAPMLSFGSRWCYCCGRRHQRSRDQQCPNMEDFMGVPLPFFATPLPYTRKNCIVITHLDSAFPLVLNPYAFDQRGGMRRYIQFLRNRGPMTAQATWIVDTYTAIIGILTRDE